jgi:hypothetical protein
MNDTLKEKLLDIAVAHGHIHKRTKTSTSGTSLTILRDWFAETDNPEVKGRHMADCRCACGNELTLPWNQVKKKIITHCGCLKKPTKDRVLAKYKETRVVAPKGHRDWTRAGVDADGVFGLMRFVGWERRADPTYRPKPVPKDQRKRSGERRGVEGTRVFWKMVCACGKVVWVQSIDVNRRVPLTCGGSFCTRFLASGYSRRQAMKHFTKMRNRDKEIVESFDHVTENKVDGGYRL